MSEADRVPDVLAEWIDRWSGSSLDAPASDLIDAGCRALASAVSLPPKDRRAAHALLAADASLTAAVGRLAVDGTPTAELVEMIVRVATELPRAGDDV